MRPRENLISEVHGLLIKSGFATSDPRDLVHAGFDIVARKDSLILVIKVAANASSINTSGVAGMLTLSRAVDATPLIVALKSGSQQIEEGVMYTRAGIPLISPGTFHDLIIEGVPPMVYAASGGYYVNIDSQILRKAREGGLSLGDLAEMGGVSRRTIKMYEDGMGAKLEVAMRLEERLKIALILPADPLDVRVGAPVDETGVRGEGLVREIFLKLHQIGYSVEAANRCPFDAVTQDRRTVLFTGIDKKDHGLERRARAINNLSRILEKHAVIFVDMRGRALNIGGTPIIGCKELDKTEDKKGLMEMIEERL